MTQPEHIAWLTNATGQFQTLHGVNITILEFNHQQNTSVISSWAKHFREHYCSDDDIEWMIEGMGKSKAQFLTEIKFPDSKVAPGPSTRSGDFAEILVADFVEYVLGYWCPRQVRYEDRVNRNVSTNGCDILAFKLADSTSWHVDDELILLETKASFRPTNNNRLQDAIDDSIKDMTREAMSLSAIKQRLRRKNIADAAKIQRFQQEVDRPFVRISGAAAVLDDDVYATMKIKEADISKHPNSSRLHLIVIKGPRMMDLVHHLYQIAADEA